MKPYSFGFLQPNFTENLRTSMEKMKVGRIKNNKVNDRSVIPHPHCQCSL